MKRRRQKRRREGEKIGEKGREGRMRGEEGRREGSGRKSSSTGTCFDVLALTHMLLRQHVLVHRLPVAS